MDIFLIIFLGSVLLVAALSDLRYQKIPNYLTYPAIIVALAYHGVTNGLDGLLFSAQGLGLGIAILILPFLMGGMGAADAKLLGAVGAILGARGVFIAFLCIGVVGGVYALILLLVRRQYLRTFVIRHTITLKTLVLTGHLIPIPTDGNENSPRLCYGVAIASGTLFSVLLESSGYHFPI